MIYLIGGSALWLLGLLIVISLCRISGLADAKAVDNYREREYNGSHD